MSVPVQKPCPPVDLKVFHRLSVPVQTPVTPGELNPLSLRFSSFNVILKDVADISGYRAPISLSQRFDSGGCLMADNDHQPLVLCGVY